jgi:hypothetical protein
MAKVKLRIVENASLNIGGRVYRAGEVVEIDRDDTAEQWLAAGWWSSSVSRSRGSARRLLSPATLQPGRRGDHASQRPSGRGRGRRAPAPAAQGQIPVDRDPGFQAGHA